MHSVLERYLREGIRPDFVTDREAAEIASSGLHLLPAPKTEGMQLERAFHFRSSRTKFVYGGYKDVEIRPGVPVETLEFDGSAPIVIDHKSTKSIDDYAKTKDDLEYDAQSVIYGIDSMFRFHRMSADLAWLYYQTKGPRRSHATTLRLHRAHAERVFDAVERVAEECADALTKNLQPLELPPNLAACKDYGGCPYRHLCTDLNKPSQIIRRKVGMSSVIANLRARVQGQTSPPPAAPPTDTKPDLFGDPTKLPAPTEIPAWMKEGEAPATSMTADPSNTPVAINPPESKLAPPPSTPVEPPKEEEKKTKRVRRTSNGTPPPPPPDPKGSDILAATGDVIESKGAVQATASGSVTMPPSVEKQELEKTIEATTRAGFTLYVDCIPIGRAARVAASLFAKAQERMAVDGPRDAAGQPVPDYRLIDYGKGAPAFVSFVLDQVDGSFDIALDTRSPEGALVLEPLMSRASFVVRGFR